MDTATTSISQPGATGSAGSPPPRVGLGRRFLVVWAGQSISAIGSAMSGIAVAVYVFVETGSLGWLGVLSALAALPSLLVLPSSGLIDRVDRRWLMVVSDSVAALGSVAALVLVTRGDPSLPLLLAVVTVSQLGAAFQAPTYQAAIPELAPPEALDRANGLVQLQQAAALVVAPAVALPLLAAGGLGLLFMVDLATFAVGAAATISVRFNPTKAERSTSVGELQGFRGGWRWLRSSGNGLLRLLGVTASVNFFLAFFNVAIIALATTLGGVSRAGWPLAIGGFAMVVGSGVVGAVGMPADRLRAARWALSAVALGIAVCAIRPTFVSLIVGVAIALMAAPVAGAATSTIFHERVPQLLQGRVFAVRTAAAQGLVPLGSMAAAAMGGWLDSDSEAGIRSALRAVSGPGPVAAPAGMLVCAAFGLAIAAAVLHRTRLDDAGRPLDVPSPGAGTLRD